MIKKITLVASFLALFSNSWGQSNPTPQTLPYSQNFGTTGFSSMPTGMAAWQGGLKTTQAAAESATPGSNATLSSVTAVQSGGGVYGYVGSSNGRVYIQQSGNSTNGTNQIALSINTGTATAINISYQLEMIGAGSSTQDFGIELMYHSGNSAATTWTVIPGSAIVISGTSFATQTYSYSLTGLSASTDYQIRWITWRPTGSGTAKGMGIDNISVSGVASITPTVAITGQDPNAPSTVNWALGSTANQFYWASISPSGGNATLSSVTANMSGTYLAADIAANGLKLYYSADATLVPAGDVLLGSQSSAKSGATENVTWSSLSQSVATGSTGYIYATADVLAGATAGRTLAGSFSSDANIVFTPTGSYSSNSYGATAYKTFAALPTNPSVFSLSCASEAQLNVSMNAPTTGTVLVFANTSGSFTDPTGSGAAFTGANASYILAANYPAVGGKLVYSGSGSNFNMTALNAGQSYYLKAYSYSGSGWSSGTAVITGTATTQPVSGIVASPSSGQITLSWSNPGATACYNNVIVIARQGSSVEAGVSKANFDGLISDADLTGANTNWTLNGNANDIYDLTSTLVGTDNTNFLVYKGTGTSVILTGLTNGTPYYFRIFTVDGTGAAAKWSAGQDANATPSQPAYYWNGGSVSALPANGGTGTWGTTNAWRQPSASGSQATWNNGNAAIFGGAAGAVTVDADRTATSYLFNTNSYTLQTSNGTAVALTGPITLASNNELVLAPNPAGSANGILGVGSVDGTGTASIRIYGNQSSTNAARVNIATANATVNVPTNIVTSTGTGVAGYVSIVSGAVVNGNITNNSNFTTCLGATSGNDITVNGMISGTSGLQFSAGATGGAGDVRLNGASTYSGGTFFNSSTTGEISIGINNALPVNGDVVMSYASGNGGIFNLNGYSQSIGNLTNNFAIGSIVNNSASTSSSLTVNQTTAQSFGLPIKDGTGTMALIKNGSAAWTLTNNTHSFSGGLILNAGELRLNPSANTTSLSVCPVYLNGGALATTGVAAGRIISFSTLKLSDNSNLTLNASTTHTLNFAASSGISWTSAKTLVITGWQGTYTTTAGSSGTAGKIFVGTNASALTSTQLSQIKFSDGVTSYDATLLANGELVPYLPPVTTQLRTSYCGYTAQSFGEFIGADSVLTANYYRFQLVNSALSYTQTFTNSSGYPYLALYLIPGMSYNTTYTVTVAWSADGVTYSQYGSPCTVTSPTAEIVELEAGSCGVVYTSWTTLISANQTSGVTHYRFRLTNTSLGYNQVFTNTNKNFNFNSFTGLTASTPYTVAVAVELLGVWNPYGPSCVITTPPAVVTTSMLPQYCGYTPSSYNELITAAPQVGSSFRFKLENTSLGYSQTFTNVNRNVNLAQYTGLTAGTTYSISVSVLFNGVYGPYGNVCQITVPSTAPTTSVVPANCGYTPSTYRELMNVHVVTGATNYQYKLENTALGYSQTFTNVHQNFNFAVFPGVMVNTTYTISARVYFNGVWGAYGPACTVTSPASSAIMLAQENGPATSSAIAQRLVDVNNEEQETGSFDAMTYPNPYDTKFTIALLNYTVNEAITIRVFDVTGKVMEEHTTSPETIRDLEIGSDYAKGLYHILISQGTSTKVMRVIRQ